MHDARLLVDLLVDPARARALAPAQWTHVVAAARAENLLGSLAFRVEDQALDGNVSTVLEDARAGAEEGRRAALWEAEMAHRALATLDVPVVLLKGTAFAAAGLSAGIGRTIGDLDILVPREAIDRVGEALLAAGWEWVKDDPYDQHYYRTWMHELPPLIHRSRDRMIDVHHTILPLTATQKPDADALIRDSVALPSGLRVLSPADIVVHAAAHLFADGDLAGGLRNLWDIDRLVADFAGANGFWSTLGDRARLHGLEPHVARALRLARRLFATPVPQPIGGGWRASDQLFASRLLARDGWGRERRKALRLGFYVRSHWMRMPPLMLARHLLIKARKRR